MEERKSTLKISGH